MKSVQRIDYLSETAAEDLVSSLHETGFAVIYNHPIAEQDIQELYTSWQEQFFESKELDKEAFHIDPKTQFGWAPPRLAEIAKGATVRDIKEFYNYYENGTCPDLLKPITSKLYHQLWDMGVTLLGYIQDKTPENVTAHFSETLTSMVKGSDANLFRINYYPEFSGEEEAGAVRAAAHADIDLLTVLTAGTTSGLQAQDKQGNWLDVPCEHGNLVINTGDMLQESSQGYFPSTMHRVIKPMDEKNNTARMSCPMFIHPRGDVKLSEHHTADSYLHERLVELGLRQAG